MKQEEWLTRYIEAAFAGVTLEDGIDLFAAQSLDDYGNPEEDRLSLTAERADWRRVTAEQLFPRFWAIPFLDAKGFRFYTPAIMTALLQPHDKGQCLAPWFLSSLAVSKDGMVKGVPFNELFTPRQRAALIRFLKYSIYNGRGFHPGDEMQVLREIQSRT